MKKILSLVLVVLFLFSGFAFAEEEEEGTWFEPNLANAFDYSATEWFSSSLNRALLTVLISLDFTGHENNSDLYEVDFLTASFVGKDDLDLVLNLNCGDQDILIFYRPVLGTGYYFVNEATSPLVNELALESVCADGCYENDIEDLAEVAALIVEAVND